jgi:predicted secreted protein
MNDLYLYVLTIAVALIGFLAKWMVIRVQKDLDIHKKNQADLAKDVMQVRLDYVHKTDLQAIRNEIMARFDKFEDRLESLRK